jgi:hypothetical protein
VAAAIMTGVNPSNVEQIRAKVRQSLAGDGLDMREGFGMLSTGERLAVALVLDRYDLLEGYGMLDAVERLGPEWFRAALYVKRNGWETEEFDREQI